MNDAIKEQKIAWIWPFLTAFGGLLFDLAPWPAPYGLLVPPIAWLVISFWVLMARGQSFFALGLLVGLLVDAAQGHLLGSTAVAYLIGLLLVHQYAARIRMKTFFVQGFHLAWIVLVIRGVDFILRGNPLDNQAWLFWISPLIVIFLWPWLAMLLYQVYDNITHR